MEIRLGPRCGCTPDEGGTLLLVLILTGLLSAVGLSLVTLVGTERTIAGNVRLTTDVQYAADALAERVLVELAARPDWSPILAGLDRSAFFSTSLDPVTPWRQRLSLVQLTTDLQRRGGLGGATGASAPVWRLFESGSMADLVGGGPAPHAYVVAWVADDESDQDVDPTTDANGCVQVQVEARGFGGLRRSVHLVVKRQGGDSSVTGASACADDSAAEGESRDLARDLPAESGGSEPVVTA